MTVGLKEELEVDAHTGSIRLAIPVLFPEGRSGFTPEHPLTFTSGSNGPFGLGWEFAVEAVARNASERRPTYVDDRRSRAGPFDGEGRRAAERADTFTLSGIGDLVPYLKQLDQTQTEWVEEVRVEGDFTVIRYRARYEQAFALIEHWLHLDGTSHWRTTSGDGVTSVYGPTPNSRVADPENPTHIFRWLLERRFDSSGNMHLYEYKSEDGQGVDRSLPSETHRFSRVTDSNNSDLAVSAQKYVKRIRYGNTKPFDDESGGLPDDNDWLFEVVLDYGEHDQETGVESGSWDLRPDPFSNYRAGFELRTYRLCRRLLLFHHFEELGDDPVLASSYEFSYMPAIKAARDVRNDVLSADGGEHEEGVDHSRARVGVILKRITRTGFRHDGPQGLWTESEPPLEFSYSHAEVSEEVHEAQNAQVPSGLDGIHYRLFDLNGEGVPGILAERDGAWYYQENLGGGNFGPLASASTTPTSRPGTYHLADLDGDGRPEVVHLNGGIPGSFESEPRSDSWKAFRPFDKAAHVSNEVESQPTDQTGDGLGDLATDDHGGITWYASLGSQGFDDPVRSSLSHDPVVSPPQIKTEARLGLFMVNLSGSGQDVACVRNGDVCYWPSLGYGRYGMKVVMENAPVLDHPDLFDPRRLHFVDLTGTGTDDLLYTSDTGATYWLNESGNGFSDGQVVRSFPPQSSLDTVSIADLLGEGTPCLVWSSPLPTRASSGSRYLRLVGETPPLLVTSIRDNMGRETRLHYASSSGFYLEDKKVGRDWVTRLQSHVPVVEALEQIDHVAGSKLSTRYVYHEGYFDGIEREFRGFSLVERYDTELFSEARFPELESDQYVTPTCTRTWFHNGATPSDEVPTSDTRHNEYSADLRARGLAPLIIEDPSQHDEHTIAEAYRALAGRVRRQEVFAVKGNLRVSVDSANLHGDLAAHPFTVTETSHRVRALQPAGEGRHGSFFVYESESLTHDYEQQSDDPRCLHEFSLHVDPLGYPTLTCTVAYPRRGPDNHSEQKKAYATVEVNGFAHITDRFYRHGIPLERLSYEIAGLNMDADGYLSWRSLRAQVSTALDTPQPFHSALDPSGTPVSRLLSWEWHYYHDGREDATRDPAQMAAPVRPHHTESAVFTDELVTSALGSRLQPADLEEMGYFKRDGYWWRPSPISDYLAADGFFLHTAETDPFGNTATVSYDDAGLFVETSTDPAGNITRTEADYFALKPRQVIDPNDNITQVRYDPLQRVIATSTHGHVRNAEHSVVPMGDEPIADYFVREAGDPLGAATDPVGEVTNDPGFFLQGATTYYRYDMFSWLRSKEPTSVVAVQRDTHVSQLDGDPRPPLVTVAYFDSFGRTLQEKVNATPGPAFIVLPDGSVEEEDVAERWLATGGTVYNNKGLPVKEFEPVYSATPRYQSNPALSQHGVTSVHRYDPLGRRIRTDTPNGFFSEVKFDPWEVRFYDENDTVERSFFFVTRIATGFASGPERDAVEQAQEHADTPRIQVLDPLGRPFLEQNVLDATTTLETHTTLDIQNNPTRVVDPRQRILNTSRPLDDQVVTYESVYDMLGRPLQQSSIDSGESRQIPDVLERQVHQWSARDYRTHIRYDALGRPTQTRITHENDHLDLITQRFTYGEDLDDPTEAKERNLLGRLVEQFDQSGMTTTVRSDLAGRPLETSQRIRKEYKTDADWSHDVELLQDTYKTKQTFDALGRIVQQTLADDTIQTISYQPNGWLDRIQVETVDSQIDAELVTAIRYNARGQRTHIEYGNSVESSYLYDNETFRLRRLLSKRGRGPGARILQEADYTYDPVGNLTRKDDRTREHILQNLPPNHDRDRASEYTYDALYRLTRATGWLHGALHQHDYSRNGIPPDAFKGTRHLNLNNGQVLTGYQREYSYDEAGNLTRIRQTGDVSWTRDMWVSENSNRSLPKQLPTGVERPDPAALFDAGGNLTELDHLKGELHWNHNDQLSAAVVIDRSHEGRENDAEYYVYGADGQRVRKVHERLVDGRLVVSEKLYLDGCEIRREDDGGRVVFERHTSYINDGDRRLAFLHTWSIDERRRETDTPGSSALHFVLEDRLGSSSLELDDNGLVISYEEFFPYGRSALIGGNKIQEVRRREYRYTGKERDDATGLQYHGLRYLAVWMGRWLNPDPLGPIDGLNLYVFARDNPIRLRDRTGGQSEVTDEEEAKRFLEERAQSVEGLKLDPERYDLSTAIETITEAKAAGDHLVVLYPNTEQMPREWVPKGELTEVARLVKEEGYVVVKLPEEISEETLGSIQLAEPGEGEEQRGRSRGEDDNGSTATTSEGRTGNMQSFQPERSREQKGSSRNTQQKSTSGSEEKPNSSEELWRPTNPQAKPDPLHEPFGDPNGKVCKAIKENALGAWAESVKADQQSLAQEAQHHGFGFAVGTGILSGLGSIGVGTVELLDTASDAMALPMAALGEYAAVVQEGKTMEIGCRLASTVHTVANTVGAIANDPVGVVSNLHEQAVKTLADAMMGDKEAVSNTTKTLTEVGVGMLGAGKGTVALRDASWARRFSSRLREKVDRRFWEKQSQADPLSFEQVGALEPGDPVLLAHYGPGYVHLPKEGTTKFYHRSARDWLVEEGYVSPSAEVPPAVRQANPYLEAVHQRAVELHARHLGGEGVVSSEAKTHYMKTGDVRRILADEGVYLREADHIYFFLDTDMYDPVPTDLPAGMRVPGQKIKRPITAAEFEMIMDHPELRRKTTFIPIK